MDIALSEWKGKSVPLENDSPGDFGLHYLHSVNCHYGFPPPPRVSLIPMSSDSIYSTDNLTWHPSFLDLSVKIYRNYPLLKNVSQTKKILWPKLQPWQNCLNQSNNYCFPSLFLQGGESVNSSIVGKAKVSTQGTSSETFPDTDKSTGFIPYEDPMISPLSAAPRSNPYVEDYIYQR